MRPWPGEAGEWYHIHDMSDTKPKVPREDLPSGRFVLRIEPELHAALRDDASRRGISLNELCSRRLAHPAAPLPEPLGAAVKQAAGLVGEGLLGVVVFGSWARDRLAPDSDVDLLMVVDPGIPIERSLYRPWDGRPLTWDGHDIEPHFAHLPEPGTRLSSFWAEVAVDGVVLFDRDLTVSRRLVDFRQRIASGEMVRRQVDGHPYWVEGA